jgi:hypothetical protein
MKTRDTWSTYYATTDKGFMWTRLFGTKSWKHCWVC